MFYSVFVYKQDPKLKLKGNFTNIAVTSESDVFDNLMFILLSFKLHQQDKKVNIHPSLSPCFLSRQFFYPPFVLCRYSPPPAILISTSYPFSDCLFTFFIFPHKQNELWAKMQFNLNRNESTDLGKYNFKTKLFLVLE